MGFTNSNRRGEALDVTWELNVFHTDVTFEVMSHVNKKIHCPNQNSSPEIWSISGGHMLAWRK